MRRLLWALLRRRHLPPLPTRFTGRASVLINGQPCVLIEQVSTSYGYHLTYVREHDYNPPEWVH